MTSTPRFRVRIAITALAAIVCWRIPTFFNTMALGGETSSDWTTTELGLTVTHDEILDTFDRCADFWPAVCRHVERQGDSIASDPARTAAVAIIRQTQSELHNRFFASEVGAQDAIAYTSWGLRRAALYRRVDKLVDDRNTLIQLRVLWQTYVHEPAGPPVDLPDQIASKTAEAVASLQLDAPTAEQIVQVSRDIARCVLAMEATSTAKFLRQAAHQTNNPQARDLLHDIVDAADWALLMDSGQGRFGVTQFKAAWVELAATRRDTTVTALK